MTASWKALTIHTDSAFGIERSCAMVGKATLTMAPSSTAIAVAMASVAKASSRCGLGRPSRRSASAGGDAAGAGAAVSFKREALGQVGGSGGPD